MSFTVALLFAIGLAFALFLAGGFWCGLRMLACLAETILRRLPWQPSLLVYGLGIALCVPVYLVVYGHGKSAALVRLSVHHWFQVTPPALTPWLAVALFAAPFFCNWVAWGLFHLEHPAPSAVPSLPPPSSGAVWPPPPLE